jgi:hypothetical protein
MTDYKVSHSLAVELKELAQQVVDQKGDWRECADELLSVLNDIERNTAPEERVIFRKFPWDSKTMALFPDQLNEKTGNIGCYTEDGGQEETSPDFGDTVAAEPHEYHSLLNALEMKGYTNLRIVKRFGKLGRK